MWNEAKLISEDCLMRRVFVLPLLALCWTLSVPSHAQDYKPVTDAMLANPPAEDWLMFSRTYDAQRFSPLTQINKQNVKQLRMAWSVGLPAGISENIPIVHDGILYIFSAPAIMQAYNAATGDLIWEYRRKLPNELKTGIARTIAIYEDMVYFTSSEGYLVALDAKTGKLRWETLVRDYRTRTQHTSGPIVVNGMVLSGRSCQVSETREGCFIAAHDARTGKEVWKFYTTAAPGEPGGDTWGTVPVDKRKASPWGLPGSYDPVQKMLYWGIANPTPYTRMKRHGSVDDIPQKTPADAYSNSTVAIDPATGKLKWYYQHLPGDDWDLDHTQERILLRTPVSPDPSAVKWINPRIRRGEQRDVLVSFSEGGGVWMNDRITGEFLWATPFPYDGPDFHISSVDVETGRASINWDKVFKKDGERVLVCSFNTKGHWPMAYHPGKNSLYFPYHDSCLNMVAENGNPSGYGAREGVARPGSDPNKFMGFVKFNMATGKVDWRYNQRVPTNGATLATAGDLIFLGDFNRRFRAFDADTGNILWETLVGGITQMSTISYAVQGKQYIAVMTGESASGTTGLLRQVPELNPPRAFNALYVFSLP